jgi:adenine nucleotide transporter 17
LTKEQKNSGRKYLTSFEIFTTGAIAKAMATIMTYPIQVAQSRQRANKDKSGSTFMNTFAILSNIFAKDGILGWFAGMNAKLVQTILTAAFQFLCYEKIQRTIFSIMGKPV